MMIKNFNEFINEDYRWGTIASGILPYCTNTKRFLIGLRSIEVLEPFTWGMFGGKLDIDEGVDETIEEASIREFEEETGYNGDVKLIKGFIFKESSFEYHNYIGLLAAEYIPELNWENDDYLWLDYEELLDMEEKHFGLIKFLEESKDIFESLQYK